MAGSRPGENASRPQMKRKAYEKELRKLQVELCRLQDWVKQEGLRVIIVFEGRDAAGKGGTIKAITERVSPRVFRVVALPAPSDREKTQMFMQRYIQNFPAAGEIIIFDRSWYNRAGVEYVMGFCTEQQHRHFLKLCPEIEGYIVDGWHCADQGLAGGRTGRAGAALCGAYRRPPAAVEAQPDGSRLLQPLVSILEGARLDAQGDEQQRRTLAHRSLGRQAACASQLHLAYSQDDPSPAGYRGRKSSCPSDPRRENTTTKRACAVSDSLPSDTNVLQPMRRQRLSLACYFM